MKISVCIPFNNCSRYLREALESVKEQSYSNWEIIIFNDGSTKKESELLKDIVVDLNINAKIISSKKSGVFFARKSLVEYASGDIIMFLDSDDYYLDNNTFKKIINEFIDKNTDCVLFNCTRNDFKKNYLDYFNLANNKGEVAINKLKSFFCTGDQSSSLCLKAFSKKIMSIEINKQTKKLTMSEDRYLFAHILDNITKCSLINEPLYFYRMNNSSITQDNYDFENFNSSIYVEKYISVCANKWNVVTYDYCSYVYHYIIYNAINKIALSEYDKAKKLMLVNDIRKLKEVDFVLSRQIQFRSFLEKVICKLFSASRFKKMFTFIFIKNRLKKRDKNE